jgi:hypothetical protein
MDEIIRQTNTELKQAVYSATKGDIHSSFAKINKNNFNLVFICLLQNLFKHISLACSSKTLDINKSILSG